MWMTNQKSVVWSLAAYWGGGKTIVEELSSLVRAPKQESITYQQLAWRFPRTWRIWSSGTWSSGSLRDRGPSRPSWLPATAIARCKAGRHTRTCSGWTRSSAARRSPSSCTSSRSFRKFRRLGWIGEINSVNELWWVLFNISLAKFETDSGGGVGVEYSPMHTEFLSLIFGIDWVFLAFTNILLSILLSLLVTLSLLQMRDAILAQKDKKCTKPWGDEYNIL